MNDNLPEIDFKEKKEKKGGLIGWLRGMGSSGSGGSMGQAGLGAAKFGAASGGFLAGKAGLIATVAMCAVAGGVYISHNAPVPTPSTGAFNSAKSDNYVPAILRSQAANQGSSLDMFKDTNKSAGLAMDDEAIKAAAAQKAAADKAAADKAAADEAAAQKAQEAAPEQGGGALEQGMEAKLQGGSMGGSLTSSLGGGSSKFSNMGGFGNKFGQGATGAKAGFSSGIGAGFSGMPKFDQRKGKLLAVKGSARPVFGGAKAGKGKFGKGSFGQAKGMRDIQRSYTGSNADASRATQDKAWEGSTGDGSTTGGGAGISDGGAGVVTSPSLDNAGSGGGGGGSGTPQEPVIPEVTSPNDSSPWKGLPQKAMMLIVMACALIAIGGFICQQAMTSGTSLVGIGAAALYAIGAAIVIAGILLGVAAAVIGIQLMATHGQTLMGGVYVLGGGLAVAGGLMALAGTGGADKTPAIFSSMMAACSPLYMLAGAAGLALIGGMAGGK